MNTIYRVYTLFYKKIHNHFELGLDLIRIYIGLALFLKGLHFMMQPQVLGQWMTAGQINYFPSLIAHYVIVAHLCGGLCLFVGLLTRIAAISQIPILFGASFLVHINEQLFLNSTHQNLELTFLTLFILIIIALIGPGTLSADHYIHEEYESQE